MLVVVNHHVVIFGLPSSRLSPAPGLYVGPEVHVRGVEPDKERLARLLLALDKIDGRGEKLLVNGFHPLLGQWSGVLYLLLPVRSRPAVQHAPRAEVLLEIREVLLRRIVTQLRFLLGIQVVEIAEELVEAVHRRQVLVFVAEVVFAELTSGITERLQQISDAGVFGPHAQRGTRDPDLAQAGAEYALPRNESGAACRAALLAVVVRKDHAFVGDPIDVRRPVSHHPFRVATQVGLPNIVTPYDKNVRLALSAAAGFFFHGCISLCHRTSLLLSIEHRRL